MPGAAKFCPILQTNCITLSRVLLLLTQLSYVYHLFSNDGAIANAAANVGSHFILNNLFTLAWILLWTRGHFWASEVMLAANYLNQHAAYWRHRTLPTFVHLSAIAGPYAWTLMALFWNGAVAVGSNSFPARIAANIFIWLIFAFGSTHILATQDDLLGYCLTFLTLGKSGLPCMGETQRLTLCSLGHRATSNQGHCSAMDLCLCHLRSLPRRVDLPL